MSESYRKNDTKVLNFFASLSWDLFGKVFRKVLDISFEQALNKWFNFSPIWDLLEIVWERPKFREIHPTAPPPLHTDDKTRWTRPSAPARPENGAPNDLWLTVTLNPARIEQEWLVELCAQPFQSPDLNINDLVLGCLSSVGHEG